MEAFILLQCLATWISKMQSGRFCSHTTSNEIQTYFPNCWIQSRGRLESTAIRWYPTSIPAWITKCFSRCLYTKSMKHDWCCQGNNLPWRFLRLDMLAWVTPPSLQHRKPSLHHRVGDVHGCVRRTQMIQCANIVSEICCTQYQNNINCNVIQT